MKEPAHTTFEKKRRKRWRFQLSLRTASIVFLLFALLSGYLARPSTAYLNDRSVAKRVEALGGSCAWIEPAPSFGATADRLLTSLRLKPLVDRTLGKVYARLIRVKLAGSDVSSDLVKDLSECEKLRDLVLDNAGLTNEMVALIASNESLESLNINHNASVTDEAARTLSDISILALTGTKISHAAHKRLVEGRAEDVALDDFEFLDSMVERGIDAVDAMVAITGGPLASRAHGELSAYRGRGQAGKTLNLREAESGGNTDELMRWWSEAYTSGNGIAADRKCLFAQLEIDASQLTDSRFEILRSGAKPELLIVHLDDFADGVIRRIVQLQPKTLRLIGALEKDDCGQLISALHSSPWPETVELPHAEIPNEAVEELRKIESVLRLKVPAAKLSEGEVTAWKDSRYFPMKNLELPGKLSPLKNELIRKRIALTINFPEK